jgi:hypothetical protein
MPKRFLIALLAVVLAALAALIIDEVSTIRRGGPTVDCKVTYLEVLSSHGIRHDGGLPVRAVSNVEMNCAGKIYAFTQHKSAPGIDFALWVLLEYGQTLKATMAGPSFVGKMLGLGPNPLHLRAP